MDDIAYRNAVKRRKELQAEINEIDQFLEMWKRYAGAGSTSTNAGNGATHAELPRTDAAGAVVERFQRKKHLPVLRTMMLQKGRPMARGEILKALEGRNIEVGGKDKGRNLGVVLWTARDQFVNISGEGYWLKDVPCPSVNYVPDENDASENGAAIAEAHGIPPE